MKKIVLIGLLIALIAGSGFYFFYVNKSHPEYEELAPDFTMEAQKLYEEFVSDGVTYSTKYNGKMLLLEGIPNKIEKIDSLTIAVFTIEEGMFGDQGVRCTFLSSKGEAINEVSDLKGFNIKGYCTGYNEVDVILEKCSLEPIKK